MSGINDKKRLTLVAGLGCASVLVIFGVFSAISNISKLGPSPVSNDPAQSPRAILSTATPLSRAISPTATLVRLPTVTIDPNCTEFDCLQTCLDQLPKIADSLEPGEQAGTEEVQNSGLIMREGYYQLAVYKINGDEIEPIFLYKVPERMKKFQQDVDLHREIWDYFAQIIPESVRSVLTGFRIFTDGKAAGATAAAHYSPPYYYLEVDIFDIDDSRWLTSTLIHETGHLITINKEQIFSMPMDWSKPINFTNFDTAQRKCGHYFSGHECSFPESYLSFFYDRFWADRHAYMVYSLYMARYEGEDKLALARQMMERHPDEFLHEFAAKDVREDIAYSFHDFIFEPKPTYNRIVDQKVLFFYEFPELVELRTEIIQNICRFAAGSK